MKRWAIMTFSVAAIVGVGYLGEKAYLSNQQHDQEIQNRIAALTIQVSDLNDRFVAASRDENDDSNSESKNAVSGLTLSMAQIFPQHWLKQTLQLAQSQLEFDQRTPTANPFDSAKNTLYLVKSNLDSLVAGHAISELTANALARAIDVDLKMIDSQAQTQRQEIQLLDRHIAQLQLTLDTLARQGPSMSAPAPTRNLPAQANATPTPELSFTQRISRLFVIEKPALNVRDNMLQRGLVCREVALTLGLARQALAQGQSDRVMHLLADSRTQLAGVVDPAARQMQNAIATLKIPTHPKLQLTAMQWAPAEALTIPVNPTPEAVPSGVTSTATPKLTSSPRVVAS